MEKKVITVAKLNSVMNKEVKEQLQSLNTVVNIIREIYADKRTETSQIMKGLGIQKSSITTTWVLENYPQKDENGSPVRKVKGEYRPIKKWSAWSVITLLVSKHRAEMEKADFEAFMNRQEQIAAEKAQ